MDYAKKLLALPAYLNTMQEIRDLEKDRIWCHHEIEHALDVCRIAWILYLEENLSESSQICREMKDRIYVAGLLHDIGRGEQYKTGIHHSVSGLFLAEEMLSAIGYPEKWRKEVLEIVTEHSEKEGKAISEGTVEHYITKADHISRNCFQCQAADSCKWEETERNRTILC